MIKQFMLLTVRMPQCAMWNYFASQRAPYFTGADDAFTGTDEVF